ncbi:MAG TPA: DUF6391 domain-containing protein, partial [Anaerolineales bacterium]|nr:DUF6391 domain-containing protein [Anaerolineales bacterium]
IVSSGPVARIRRNHGLEHATLHILAEQMVNKPLAGHSDLGGFWIIGDVSTEVLRSAIDEALSRMQAGEEELAVHPNCGTNFVTAGTLAGAAAMAALFGAGRRTRDKLERLPLAASLATFGLMLAQPAGSFLQKHVTTSGIPGSLEVVAVTPTRRGRFQAHRVETRG